MLITSHSSGERSWAWKRTMIGWIAPKPMTRAPHLVRAV
jgi:hypothetical protein